MGAGRILVADDSSAVRSILRKRLVAAGFEVLEAADGQQAVQAARASRPDLVLLDVEMPVLDGFEVMSVLRTDDLLRDVPVIFLTSRVDTSELVEGLDLGAFDYVKKPCDVGELVARVRAGVRWKARADELRRLAEEVDVLGSTDVLTELPNRRALERRMSHLVEAPAAAQGGIVVALVDVDHFKQVNDLHGHQTGDAVLRAIAQRLQAAARPGQVVGRWGGEEFLALSPALSGDGAVRFGERLRTLVGWEPVPVEAGPTLDVTVSVGLAAGPPSELERLVAQADAALYRAKNEGRNRVVLGSAA